MRLRIVVVALALGAAGCGTFWSDALRNITEEPIRRVDDCRTIERNRRLAREAWHAVERSHPGVAYPPDYADGFEDGFAEYLYEGGNGQPPAVPPFRYCQSRYQTPQGHQAILDWYDGYREGAAAARASGLREVIVVPLSAPPINAVQQRPSVPPEPAPPAPADAPPPEPAPELPPPRSLPPGESPPPSG